MLYITGLPEEIYGLAVAIYSTKDADPSVLKVATQLFAYAGECGDHNAQYSYAQLLRAGTVVNAVCMCIQLKSSKHMIPIQRCSYPGGS